MSSKRTPRKNPFPIAPDTFGKAPAALYLAHLLNEAKDEIAMRKISAILQAQRQVVNELAAAHVDYDVLSTKTFANLLNMLSENLRENIGKSLAVTHPFYAQLVINILEGQLKTWKRRVQAAVPRFKQLQRNLGPNVKLDQNWVPAEPLEDEKDALTLKERSARYLERKGKRNTLY
jgi:hypothetical protein